MRRHFLISPLLLLGLTLGPLCAQTPPETGGQGFHVPDVIARSQAQEPFAMVAHAMLLLDGTSLPYDPEQAARLAQAAAAAGNRQGKLLLVIFLEQGVGMARDPVRAAHLLEELAESGLPEALYMRAMDRAAQDPEAAMTDLRLAGAQGHLQSLQVLATLRSWDEMAAATAPSNPETPAPDRNMIIALQAMLGQLDLFAGPPSGALDPDTITAIVLYQVAHGLPTDGQPSAALRDHVAATLAQSRQGLEP